MFHLHDLLVDEAGVLLLDVLQLSVGRVGDLLLGVRAHADEVGDDLHGVDEFVIVTTLNRLYYTRLRRIVTCIGQNQKNQPNLDLYLVRRYKICHFP